MTGIEALGAIGPGTAPLISQLGVAALPPSQAQAQAPTGFADLLTGGLRQVEGKLATANDLVRQFAIDDQVPLHQVTFALEEARLSVELAMQVRARVLESYREFMNMQL